MRVLRRLLEDEEQLKTLGVGSAGLRGRLRAATERRLLIVGKWPLRPAQVEQFAYEELASPQIGETSPFATNLSFKASGREISYDITPHERARDLADLIGQGAQRID